MRKASTALLEQGTQTPSPAPDLIPAEPSIENLHWNWYSKRGHFTMATYTESGSKGKTAVPQEEAVAALQNTMRFAVDCFMAAIGVHGRRVHPRRS